MSDVCLNCGGAIFSPNAIVGYAGPICYCPRPPQVQRPASETFHIPLTWPMPAPPKPSPLVTLTLPGRPRVLKNGKRIFGRGRRKVVLPSPQYALWERNALRALSVRKNVCLVDFPCVVHMRFYLANRSGEPDVSNLIEGPADVMQKAGILKDDKLIMRVQAEKFFGAEPRVEIEIYKYEKGAE